MQVLDSRITLRPGMGLSILFEAFMSRHNGDRGQKIRVEARESYFQFSQPDNEKQQWPRSSCRIEAIPGAKKWKIFRQDSDSSQSFWTEDESGLRKALQFGTPLSGQKEAFSAQGKQGIRLLLFVLLVFLGGLVLFIWKGIPLLADSLALRIPLDWEEKLGNQADVQIRASMEVDSGLTRKLNAWMELCSVPEADSDLPIVYTVVKNPGFNAFAIPGRRIYVHTGALAKIESEDELLALLGHEAGHVMARHPLRSLVQSASSQILLSLFFENAPGELNPWIARTEELRSLAYSRDFEREADRMAHDFVCQNHANPEGLVRLMERLSAESGGGGEGLQNFLETHPAGEERIENAKETIRLHPCPHPERPDDARKAAFIQLKTNGNQTGSF